MYKPSAYSTNKIKRNVSKEGQPLEKRLQKMKEGKERITAEAPILFFDKKDGVRPETNIRADRFDIALEAIEKGQKSEIAAREAAQKKEDENQNDPLAGGQDKK